MRFVLHENHTTTKSRFQQEGVFYCSNIFNRRLRLQKNHKHCAIWTIAQLDADSAFVCAATNPNIYHAEPKQRILSNSIHIEDVWVSQCGKALQIVFMFGCEFLKKDKTNASFKLKFDISFAVSLVLDKQVVTILNTVQPLMFEPPKTRPRSEHKKSRIVL